MSPLRGFNGWGGSSAYKDFAPTGLIHIPVVFAKFHPDSPASSRVSGGIFVERSRPRRTRATEWRHLCRTITSQTYESHGVATSFPSPIYFVPKSRYHPYGVLMDGAVLQATKISPLRGLCTFRSSSLNFTRTRPHRAALAAASL